PAAAARERGVHAAPGLRRARQLRAVFRRGLRQRRRLHQRHADEHRQPRCPEGHARVMKPAASRWALLFGNFAIGCGVVVVPGALNDLPRSLQVSAALGGQLIALAAGVMCFGAPLLAAAVAGWDRRRLLTVALVWYALGHAVSALMPGYAALAVVRMATM